MDVKAGTPIILLGISLLLLLHSIPVHCGWKVESVSLPVNGRFAVGGREWKEMNNDVSFRWEVVKERNEVVLEFTLKKELAYFAWGLTQSGAMFGADIIIFDIGNEKVLSTTVEHHGVVQEKVDATKIQVLSWKTEALDSAVIQLSRPLVHDECTGADFSFHRCVHKVPIGDAAVQVVYSKHVQSEDSRFIIPLHTVERLSIRFRSPSLNTNLDIGNLNGLRFSSPSPLPIPGDAKNDYEYHCYSEVLSFASPEHMVGYQVHADQPELHHINVHLCDGRRDTKIQKGVIVSGPACESASCPLIISWNHGGGPLLLPSEAGIWMSAGEHRLILQYHYRRNKLKRAVGDNSEISIYFTENIRQINASFLQGGVFPAGTRSGISFDKNLERVVVSSVVSVECFVKYLGYSSTGYGLLLNQGHMHERGVGFYMELRRKNETVSVMAAMPRWSWERYELAPPTTDERMHVGDMMIVHCFYNPKQDQVSLHIVFQTLLTYRTKIYVRVFYLTGMATCKVTQ